MSILKLTNHNNTVSTVTTNDARSDQVKLRRKNLLIFVKILFRLLQQAGDELLLEQAKRIVAQCRHNTSPHHLDHTIAKELKYVVGEHFFMKAKRLLTIYLRRRQKETRNPAPAGQHGHGADDQHEPSPWHNRQF
jgi:hypothetical protein